MKAKQSTAIRRAIIDEIIDVEGGYVDDPSDSGGETNWGITKAVAREFGYDGAMRDLSKKTARKIYRKRYWMPLRLNVIAPIVGPQCAHEIMDTAVNTGVSRAAKFLQAAINVVEDRPVVACDGLIGRKTLGVLRRWAEDEAVIDDDAVLDDADTDTKERRLHDIMNILQAAFYIELAERREKDERFVYGWLLNRCKMECKFDSRAVSKSSQRSDTTEAMQRVLNVMNRIEKDYPDIAADGIWGPKTQSSYDAYLAKRKTEGERVLNIATYALIANLKKEKTDD